MRKIIGRLSLYRRILASQTSRRAAHIYSHELAALAGVTAAQVRRDMMQAGFAGSPAKGYNAQELIEHIGRYLDDPEGHRIALVGVGNLGRALLAYFQGRRAKLTIVAAFDKDPANVNRVVHGCRCYPMTELCSVVSREGIGTAVLTVPASEAQAVADQLFGAGIKGILNFAPTPLKAPAEVYVEDMDITMALEKVVYFARERSLRKGEK